MICSVADLLARMPSSAPDHQLQVAREERERERSVRAAEARRRQLRESGALARTEGGRRLFRRYAERVVLELERVIAVYSVKKAPGVHHAAIPLLELFDRLERAAIVLLRTGLNQLASPCKYRVFCLALGEALELEQRAMRLAARLPSEMPRLRRRNSSMKRLLRPETMEDLGVPVPRWDNETRFSLGAFCADVLVRVGLVDMQMTTVAGRSQRWMVPTGLALRSIGEMGPELIEVTHGAMVTPPRPWTGHFGGGHLDNPFPLIRAGRLQRMEETCQADELPETVLAGVNWLQAQALRIDPELVDVERLAWKHSTPGLWPQARVPPEIPEQPSQKASQADWKVWKRQAALAHQNRRLYRALRLDCERRVSELEAMAGEAREGRIFWQAHHLDFRGRIYAVNRCVTHQAPDPCKAAISFADARQVDEEGFEWMLRAAAGHHGLGRATWDERLEWGRAELQRHVAVAEDPIARVQLWRDASDPWQYLQVARAIRDWTMDRSTPIGVPIRFDQTTSGCGILAALIRDEEIGRLTNMVGDTRGDLYDVVAQLLHARVRADLESEEPAVRYSAEKWLKRGIDRKLCKPAVLARPYGGTMRGLEQQLVELRDEELGGVSNRDFRYQVGLPADYLARRMWKILCAVTNRLMAVSRWIRQVARLVIAAGHEPVVTAPSGLVQHLGMRATRGREFHSWIAGQACITTLLGEEKAWSPERTCKTISANWVHGFDGAFCARVAALCCEQGIPLLTNHDCFAAPAWAAGRLHAELLREAHRFWLPDWLAIHHDELQRRSGVDLPPPPERGTLQVGLIGRNPYLFS